jgi:outer membrane protein OmpA-like peptidoglycan-associated protein
VLFGFGQTTLTQSAMNSLNKLSQALKEYPNNLIAVEGHTDRIGSRAYNQELSEKRALNVAKYLVQQGIDSKRLKVTGFGKDNPIASNTTSDGRQANRRVEVIILK